MYLKKLDYATITTNILQVQWYNYIKQLLFVWHITKTIFVIEVKKNVSGDVCTISLQYFTELFTVRVLYYKVWLPLFQKDGEATFQISILQKIVEFWTIYFMEIQAYR